MRHKERMARRRFLGYLAAAFAGTMAGPTLTRAGAARRGAVRFINTTPVLDSQLAFITIGAHPRLGYYEQEGLDITYTGLGGAQSVLQALALRRAEVGIWNPINYLPAYAQGQGLPIKAFYLMHQQFYVRVAVLPDAPYQRLEDLAGKRIGIIREGDTGAIATRVMLNRLGFDPQRDVRWVTVGQGAPALNALQRNVVDALAIWDAEFARLENLGGQFKYVQLPPETRALPGWYWSTASPISWAEWVGPCMRAMTKATIFTQTNPEAAVKLHWDLYPESKPTGIPEDRALKEALHVLGSRLNAYYPADKDGNPDPNGLYGYIYPERLWAYVRWLGLESRIRSIDELYTNEFIQVANDFSREAIRRQAAEFRV